MKALVYHGPGQKSWDTVPDPAPAEPTDIVVQIDATTICGTDLHILKGDVPAVTDGRILGHEAVGTVTAVGSAVSTLVEGDRVLVPAITSCGRCAYCKRAMPSHCQATGGICTRVVRPGGTIANIGVHGAPTTLHLEELWIKNVTITTGRADGTTVPLLLQLVRSGKIAAEMFGTHDFALHDMMAAYDTFAEAGKHNALKVVIRR